MTDLNEQMQIGGRIISDLVWSILSNYNSMLLEKGYKREDLKSVAEEFDRQFSTGAVTIRKKPKPRTKKMKMKQGDDDGKEMKKKGKFDDIVSKVRADRAKRTNLTQRERKLMMDEMGGADDITSSADDDE